MKVFVSLRPRVAEEWTAVGRTVGGRNGGVLFATRVRRKGIRILERGAG